MKDLNEQEREDLMRFILSKTGAKSLVLIYASHTLPSYEAPPVEMEIASIGIGPSLVGKYVDRAMGPYKQGILEKKPPMTPPPAGFQANENGDIVSPWSELL